MLGSVADALSVKAAGAPQGPGGGVELTVEAIEKLPMTGGLFTEMPTLADKVTFPAESVIRACTE